MDEELWGLFGMVWVLAWAVLLVVVWHLLARLAARPQRPEPGPRPIARLLLMLYWLAAAVASTWILRALPWPAWTAAGLWGLANALVPIAGALLLWPRPAARGALWCLRLLLADASPATTKRG